MDRNTTIEKLIESQFVLIALDGKRPTERDWPKRTVSLRPADLGPDANVGAVLGDASGVVDADIDSLSAEPLADIFLPHSDCVFGRASKPKSHRLYRVEKSGRTIQFQSPEGMVVELRGNGSQTMVPPSVHPSGEPVTFSLDGPPTPALWEDLLGSVADLAMATVLHGLVALPPN